jgi:isopenicillin N synthase-like dioxygenase
MRLEFRGGFVMGTIPVLDVSGLTSAELSERAGVAAELGHACRGIGFFYIVNHGVAEALRDTIFRAARAFFSLPVTTKEQYSIKRSRHNRGYVALEGERLKEGAAVSDYKEAFNIGLELAADDPEVLAGKPFRGANLWPGIGGWRNTVLAYYDACWDLGRRIHRGFAIDLGIEENFFEDKLDAPLAILRMLHYPPQPQRCDCAPDRGAGMHTDYGT